ncbi:MAG: ATPase domain-containing protein [Candidatus Woesearchaeota archaeon]
MKKRVRTGIKGLDQLLRGGIIEGRTVLLSGPCGSGKSVLGMQFIHNGIKDFKEPGLYVSFEEGKNSLMENMYSFGFDLKKLEKTKKFVLVGGGLGTLDSFMKKVGAETDHVIEEIKELVRENKIKRVVVDSVSLFGLLAKTSGERRKAFARLSSSLSELGCTSLLISETKEGTFDLSRYGIEEFIVDGVIALYHLRQGERFVPGIVVRKMRGSDHDKNIRLFNITNKGIVVYPKETLFANL